MKKLIPLLVLAILSWYLFDKYGYLLNSAKNFPKSSTVDTNPAVFEPIVTSPDELSYLKIEPGYEIGNFATDVPGARSLAIGDNGVVYVGTRSQGVVYALVDEDQDGMIDHRYVVASGLSSPNGVVYKDNSLYVAEIHRIIKFEDITQNYANKPNYNVVYDNLPKDAHHGWRYMALGPDDKLYLGIGAPCNTCEVSDPYGSIARLSLDGSGFEIVAIGIRNTVGFDWDPIDDTLWFSENGRDELGEDIPGDELNKVSGTNTHFGFPYCHAGTILDPKFGKDHKCSDYTAPAVVLDPHVAALGIKFVDNKILIAEHGSWNRRIPIGYRVMQVDIKDGVASNYRPFITGWLDSKNNALGRPVDISVTTNGSILISDDLKGKIYKITKLSN